MKVDVLHAVVDSDVKFAYALWITSWTELIGLSYLSKK